MSSETASNVQTQEFVKSAKKRKTSRACLSCQKAHLTCSDTRPCVRCHKRDEPCIEGEKKKARYLFTPEELEALKLAKQAEPSGGPKSKRVTGSAATYQTVPKQKSNSKPNVFIKKSGEKTSTVDGLSTSANIAQPPPLPVGPSSVHSGDQHTPSPLSVKNLTFNPPSSSRACHSTEKSRPDPSRIIQPFTNLQAKPIPDEFKVFVGKNEYQRSPNENKGDQGWENGKDTQPSSINSRLSPPPLSAGFNPANPSDDLSRIPAIPARLSGSSTASALSSDPLTPGFIATLFAQHRDQRLAATQSQTGPPPLQPPSHRPASASSQQQQQQHQQLLLNSHPAYPNQSALFSSSQDFAQKHQFASSDIRSIPSTDTREEQDIDRSWSQSGDPLFWRNQLSLHQQRSSQPQQQQQQQQSSLPPSQAQNATSASSTQPDPSQIDSRMNQFSTSSGLEPQYAPVNPLQSSQPAGFSYGPQLQLSGQVQSDLAGNRTPPPIEGKRPLGSARQSDSLFRPGNEGDNDDERLRADGMKGRTSGEQSKIIDGRTRKVADRRATQPYQYGKTYRRMIKFARERYGEMDAMRLVQSIAEFRPKMLSMSANHTTFQDILLEEALLASLSDLTSTLFPLTGTPTAIWRRTGEIVAASPELCILTEWAEGELLFGDREDEPELEGGRFLDDWEGKHIWEIMEKQSFLEYGELFTKCAFEGTSPSFDLTCTLVSPDGRPVTCSACFSIKKDIFDLPSLIIGQFLPLL